MNLTLNIRQLLSKINATLAPKDIRTSEAIVLKWTRTGRENSKGNEVKLLLQINPSKGRSFLREYIDYFTREESIILLQTGQTISVLFDNKNVITRLILLPKKMQEK